MHLDRFSCPGPFEYSKAKPPAEKGTCQTCQFMKNAGGEKVNCTIEIFREVPMFDPHQGIDNMQGCEDWQRLTIFETALWIMYPMRRR
jgi:hypothetical protein